MAMLEDGLCGLPEMPLRRQPNAYTCGPTALRMVMDQLGFRPELTITQLSRQMGCNPQTGTTEVEMARGLAVCGLSNTHPGIGFQPSQEEALDHLRAEIGEHRQLVLLRTLIRGCKHWVLVHAFSGEGDDCFHVACPSLGAQEWSGDELHDAWAARDYDHFCVPVERRFHPEALATEREARRAAWRPVHEMRLAQFIGQHPIIEEADYQPHHHSMLDAAATRIQRLARHPKAREMAYEAAPEFRFLAIDGQGGTDLLVITERSTGVVVGGIADATRWVNPEFRGRGLGAELVLAACSEPGSLFLAPVGYSRAGHASRVAAHRLAVARALDAGLPVPEAVQTDHAAGAGASPTPR